MARNLLIVLALVAIVALPFVLKPKDSLLGPADETLVIITPHIEAIRYEFARGFPGLVQGAHGQDGADRLARAGRHHGDRPLSGGRLQAPFEVSVALQNQDALGTRWPSSPSTTRRSRSRTDPAKDTEAQMARRTFWTPTWASASTCSSGAGASTFSQQAAAGRLVDCGFIHDHPELFGDGPNQIPQSPWGRTFLGQGRPLDRQRALLLRHLLQRRRPAAAGRGKEPPRNWKDLADPVYFGEVASGRPQHVGCRDQGVRDDHPAADRIYGCKARRPAVSQSRRRTWLPAGRMPCT